MITILCSGSRGDIQPYIALAQELIALGKSVRIAAGRSYADFVTDYGVGFVPLAADLQTAGVDPRLLTAARSADNPLRMILAFRKMKSFAEKTAASMTEEMVKACEGSDLIIYHPGCSAGYFAARQMGIPAILATPFPLHATKRIASIATYGRYRAVPRGLSHKLLQGMLWSISKSAVAKYWREQHGALPQDFGCPFERLDARHLAVVSCSNAIFPRPDDWSEHVHQHGYWFVNEPRTYAPPQELAGFLAAGEKPVYVGFGSVLGPEDGERLSRLAVEALQMAGKRGILCGMGGVGELPDTVYSLASIPHGWLFPRTAAVCHHGGAGTTAAGFAAGVPNVVIPASNDQFAWGHRAYELGVGARPIPMKTLTAQKLADAITQACSDQMRQRAEALGKAVRAEDGARRCAEAIAACAARR